MKEEVLGMEHVTYTEDGQLLLEQFHMRIFRGEIMGIVCDDNRGKGALTKILQLESAAAARTDLFPWKACQCRRVQAG